ncbi:amidase [Gemmatimonas groenlandica]|uniref:Amidase n=2 Tax=Gemmatimonas groenlandica TaxID=2732249 RepID=A0A6M4J180_9BACT|nr:amidase [Gemmatimonas groenlandica]
MPADELTSLSATELAARIRRKSVSAREVLEAHLARIERVNPTVNAIVTLVPEQARAWAKAADERQARGEPLGPLHGLPVAHKDLVDTAGIRTTKGSLLYKDNVPTTDALIVQRIRSAGAITLGKTNTPEFGAGSNTFNAVFGATKNGFNLQKTVGGSSGGAACALNCNLLPIADGSDTGGSLRNPGAWNNIVGFRPSPGRVPDDDGSWSPLSTSGPMARSVEDVALFLSAIAGVHAPDPSSLSDDPAGFRRPLAANMKGKRIAWFTNMGGLPFEPEITRVLNANRQAFIDMGCIVEDAEPDFSGVDEAFPALRHLTYHTGYAKLSRDNPSLFKDTVKWEIAEAERQGAVDVARANARQAQMYRHVSQFFAKYDAYVCPVTQVEPFDITTEYPTTVAGVTMPTYIDWMRSAWYVTFMQCPAISVPAGFSANGLPVGAQIVGKPRGDWALLQLAHAFEQATGHGKQRPVF